MKYLCLVYQEDGKGNGVPQRAADATAAEDLDELGELLQSDQYIASGRLQPAETAATVRVRNGSVFISGGPAAGTTEHLGGFYLIDARDLNDAIRIAAKLAEARLGWIEVRPLEVCNRG